MPLAKHSLTHVHVCTCACACTCTCAAPYTFTIFKTMPIYRYADYYPYKYIVSLCTHACMYSILSLLSLQVCFESNVTTLRGWICTLAIVTNQTKNGERGKEREIVRKRERGREREWERERERERERETALVHYRKDGSYLHALPSVTATHTTLCAYTYEYIKACFRMEKRNAKQTNQNW